MAKTTQYSYKPRLIGVVIKRIMAEKQLDKKVIAQQMGVSLRTFELWYEAEYLPMKHMMKLSPLLDYNLFLEYHPNMKPAPNPLQAQLDEAKEAIAERDLLKRENAALKTKNIQLEAANDTYRDMLEKFAGRKG
jgi:hypothetical protein